MTDPVKKYEPLIIAYLTGQASLEDITHYKNLYKNEADFRAHVSRIEKWLSPLNAETSAKAPPETLLSEIMAHIDDEEAPNDKLGDKNITAPATTPVRQEPPLETPANDNRLTRWKFATFAASLIAALAIGSHLMPTTQSPTSNPLQSNPVQTVQAPTVNTTEPNPLIALLSDDTQPSLVAIVYDPATLKIVARLSNVVLPKDGDLELWLIREGAGGPVSLGLLNKTNDKSDTIEFVLPQSLRTVSDTLAISLEPVGGSGTETGPQGPILFTGGVSEI